MNLPRETRTMTTHLEIESKFDAEPGQALPDFVGVAGVVATAAEAEMVLTATYFDTESLALGAAGATLRRRTGGTDDGWHLKLSVADGERLEVHRALGRSGMPPAALASLVRAMTRGDALVPVATLVTRRGVHRLLADDGRVLVEIADDQVTGERAGTDEIVAWREIEAELVDGDRAVLAAVAKSLTRAGLSVATGSSKVGRVLGVAPPTAARARRKDPAVEVLDAGRRAALRGLLTADPLLRVDRPGAASRMRAAIARLRAALAVGAEIATRLPGDPIRAELGWLDDVVAPLERADTVPARLRAALSREPRDLVLGPVQRRIDRELAATRKAALAGVRAALDSPRYLTLLAALAPSEPAAGLEPARVRAGDLLPDLSDRNARRAERRLAQLRRAQSDEERRWLLVGVRRAVERARYAGSLRPGDPPAQASLDEAADLLAELAALLSSQDALRAIAGEAHRAGENTFTFGRLHGLEEVRAEAVRRRLNAVRKELKRARQP
jgi:inorganic triphosphatase YgiF